MIFIIIVKMYNKNCGMPFNLSQLKKHIVITYVMCKM